MEKISYFENDILVIDVQKLVLKPKNKKIKLSKNQTRLIDYLVKGINQREEIVKRIWHSEDYEARESSYNQLICRTRALLSANGLPDDFIITLPRYGVCINQNYIKRAAANSEIPTKMYNDHSCLG
ncbi:winged helix-turn-helix domain-containing protein [Erwinia persicina]|uniref:winged helix-turn-helix domain-containing protein n=1 Tax=Erwinia persicina TaxID=55211 RepID=UPI001780CEC3|nr:winged helix-turn-helix domain-containing protein [Erwinia persicina]MBD8162645.1 winged helix-turn-helix domain-containing protein [Erwinia persicina]MBD8214711.1 winged helix-turn-helix domain-containing protein [Erwinia persicina]